MRAKLIESEFAFCNTTTDTAGDANGDFVNVHRTQFQNCFRRHLCLLSYSALSLANSVGY